MKNLKGECNRASKKLGPTIAGAIADILLVSFFHTHNKGNDPYMLERKSHNKNGYSFMR